MIKGGGAGQQGALLKIILGKWLVNFKLILIELVYYYFVMKVIQYP